MLRSRREAPSAIITVQKFRFSTWNKIFRSCWEHYALITPSPELVQQAQLGRLVQHPHPLPVSLVTAVICEQSEGCPEQSPMEICSEAWPGWCWPRQRGQGTSAACHFQGTEGSTFLVLQCVPLFSWHYVCLIFNLFWMRIARSELRKLFCCRNLVLDCAAANTTGAIFPSSFWIYWKQKGKGCEFKWREGKLTHQSLQNLPGSQFLIHPELSDQQVPNF